MVQYVNMHFVHVNRYLLTAALTAVFFMFSVISTNPGFAQEINLNRIKLPPGFEISVFASRIFGARSMALSPQGILFVGTRKEGNVYAVMDHNKDNKADEVIAVARGLNSPNGVAFKDGALYVAEINRILRYDDIETRLKNPPKPVVVNESFPREKHHGWKLIHFGPDGMLYVPIGAPCNICESQDKRIAAILRMQPNGKNVEIFAHGVRNTVGFDWHPMTKELWFTDNGRDWMGDDKPPDELNHSPVAGMHYGYAYCHGNDLRDPRYGLERDCSEFVKPAIELGPHVAALGRRFYTGKMFPAAYQSRIFIAEHGSWNRAVPIGYRITTVTLEGNKPIKYEVFAEGWLDGALVYGRPVDVLLMNDGSLLISDDRADAIYRISYRK